MNSSPSVVVGFDGSEASMRAVDWASDEAVRRGRALAVLSASEPVDVRPRHGGGPSWMPADVLPSAQALTAAGIARASARQPKLAVQGWPVVGRAVDALVSVSGAAAMVVVGSRGHGEVVGDLLGSVANGLVTRGQGHVVVVRGNGDVPIGPDHPVVVGVDGGTGAQHAVDVAARLAGETAAELVVVSAIRVPARETYAMAGAGAVDLPVEGAARRGAEQVLRHTAARLAHDLPHLVVRTVCREGSAASVLTDVESEPGLLVVGSRGRGSLAAVLLGSTGRRVSHAAGCPVLVVHADVAAAGGPTG